jgi:acyl carrier protein
MNLVDQRIQRIFREVFENDALQVHDDLSAQTLADWDSLAQVKLILGLEEEFGVKFTTAEVAELNSVQSLKSALAGKCAV